MLWKSDRRTGLRGIFRPILVPPEDGGRAAGDDSCRPPAGADDWRGGMAVALKREEKLLTPAADQELTDGEL